MKNQNKMERIVNVIALLVILFSAICCVLPFLTHAELEKKTMLSAFGETVELYGKGLYARNSISCAVQAVAQDLVTLVLVIPGMIFSLVMIQKKKVLGQYILTGLFGYMLYTYMSYSFLMFYNDLFLLYVANMILSFYGLVISISILSKSPSVDAVKENLPTRGLRIFLIFSGIAIFLMWIGRIVPTLGKDIAPAGLDNCTTLVIQALDLGVIVPACFVIAFLLKIKHKLGYILGLVIVVKAVTLVTAVLAMAVYMKISGVEVENAMFIIFGIICALSFYYFVSIVRKMWRII